MDHGHEWLTSDETADLIRQSLAQLYWLNSRGDGPPRYRTGRRILYRRSEVIAWLESRRVEPAAAAH
jgi:predicted DNA-binding transcriptional regulator AlpA